VLEPYVKGYVPTFVIAGFIGLDGFKFVAGIVYRTVGIGVVFYGTVVGAGMVTDGVVVAIGIGARGYISEGLINSTGAYYIGGT
jgi:hypothetical protein